MSICNLRSSSVIYIQSWLCTNEKLFTTTMTKAINYLYLFNQKLFTTTMTMAIHYLYLYIFSCKIIQQNLYMYYRSTWRRCLRSMGRISWATSSWTWRPGGSCGGYSRCPKSSLLSQIYASRYVVTGNTAIGIRFPVSLSLVTLSPIELSGKFVTGNNVIIPPPQNVGGGGLYWIRFVA